MVFRRCRAALGKRAGSAMLLGLLGLGSAIADPAPPASAGDQALQATGVGADYTGDLPSLAALNIRDAKLETVLSGLDRPRAFEFIAADEVLISEIGGRLLRYRFGDAGPRSIVGLPEVSTRFEQTGLLDVALHPNFSNNRRIYFTYSQPDPEAPQYSLTALATAILGDDALDQLQTLLAAGPYSWSPSNFGGAIAFDDRGFLFVSIGDRSEEGLAQQGDRLQGKILRLHDDGSTPADNPFVSDPRIDDRIYALGVRNPQGLHFDPISGSLFETEHGPMGGDELNLIEAGGNYGWPSVGYGRSYDMRAIGSGTHAAGMRQPLFYYLPSIATSPLLMYRGSMFPEWEGDLLIGALKGQHVSWLDLDGKVVRAQTPMLGELQARIRDLKVGADGALYILTQAGGLHRLRREKPVVSQPLATATPTFIYDVVCAGCHATGAYRAPNPAQPEDWRRVLAEPLEQAYERTRKGHGAMPERGLCQQCTDAQLRAVVDLMLSRARAAKAPKSVETPGFDNRPGDL
jgi:glucose/arabinose dehydrogenase